MSQTFHIQSSTRLHPSEWSTGVAAGGAAAFMIRNNVSSTATVSRAHMPQLQAWLNSSAVGQPLEWDVPHPAVPSKFQCAVDKFCVSVVAAVNNGTLYPTDQCASTCAPLAASQWLAYAPVWRQAGSTVVVAQSTTVLKKSTAQAAALPPADVLSAPVGTKCTLLHSSTWGDYYLVDGCV